MGNYNLINKIIMKNMAFRFFMSLLPFIVLLVFDADYKGIIDYYRTGTAPVKLIENVEQMEDYFHANQRVGLQIEEYQLTYYGQENDGSLISDGQGGWYPVVILVPVGDNYVKVALTGEQYLSQLEKGMTYIVGYLKEYDSVSNKDLVQYMPISDKEKKNIVDKLMPLTFDHRIADTSETDDAIKSEISFILGFTPFALLVLYNVLTLIFLPIHPVNRRLKRCGDKYRHKLNVDRESNMSFLEVKERGYRINITKNYFIQDNFIFPYVVPLDAITAVMIEEHKSGKYSYIHITDLNNKCEILKLGYGKEQVKAIVRQLALSQGEQINFSFLKGNDRASTLNVDEFIQ